MSKAEQYVDKPSTMPDSFRDLEDQTREVANQTQDVARTIIDCGDGSQIEVAIAPKPKYEGDTAPTITDDNEGFLALADDGKLYRAWVTERENGGRGPGEGAIVEAEWREIEPGWAHETGRILYRKALVNEVQLG